MLDAIGATFPVRARGARMAPLVVGLWLGAAACQQQGAEDPAADTAAHADTPGPADAGGAGAPGADRAAADSPAVLPSDTPPKEAVAAAGDSAAADPSAPPDAPAPSGAAGAQDWMNVDEAGQSVSFDIVAGFDPTNGAWNFNGYADGDLTITVPQGWRVTIRFSNHDANVPHSLLFSEREPPFPQVFEPETAFPAAYTVNPQAGIGANREDRFSFTAGQAGRFTMPCGVPGHAASGMWNWFVVSAEAARPGVETAS